MLVLVSPIIMNSLFGTFFPNGTLRLQGVYGIRFKLVFTLQVAATPFHQGLLAMSWQYDSGVSDTTTFLRASRSETCTNLPRVRLDLSADTMVILEIPFIASTEFLPISQESLSASPYGTISINNLLPVAAVIGLASPTYKLYVHLEELELIGARAAAFSAVLPQIGKRLAPIEEEASAAKPSSMVAKVSDTVRFIGYVHVYGAHAFAFGAANSQCLA
jgi:hypothetical protein